MTEQTVSENQCSLASLVPKCLLHVTDSEQTDIICHQEPTVQPVCGSVLFLDVSRFTQLCQMLSTSSSGIALLTEHMNTYFSSIINCIYKHGGEIERFAGDGVISTFLTSTMCDSDPVSRLRSAIDCALEIVEKHGEYRAASLTLQIRMGIVYGDFEILQLGGRSSTTSEEWKVRIVQGKPFDTLSKLVSVGSPKELWLSESCFGLVKEEYIAAITRSENENLAKIIGPKSIRKARVEMVESVTESRISNTYLKYIDPLLRKRIQRVGFQWANEKRYVTTAFVKLPSTDVNELHRVTCVIQSGLEKFKGSLANSLRDEKGVIFLLVFGYPYSCLDYGNDSVRAMLCLTQIEQDLIGIRSDYSITITSGYCFSGTIGAEIRREFSILGPSVNIGARLIPYATNKIVCDKATMTSCSKSVGFEHLGSYTVKGMIKQVDCYTLSHLKIVKTNGQVLYGRDRETEIVETALSNFRTSRKGRIIHLHGKLGVGTRTFLRHVENLIHQEDLRCLVVKMNPYDGGNQFNAWRDFFATICSEGSDAERDHFVSSLLPDHRDYLSLLNPYLSTCFPETEHTRNVFQVKQKTVGLLVKLVTAYANKQDSPLVLILNEYDSFDQNSKDLLLLLTNSENLMIFVTSTNSWPELEENANITNITLHEVDKESLGKVLVQALNCRNVRSIDPKLLDILYEKFGGNPLYSIEVVLEGLEREVMFAITKSILTFNVNYSESLASKIPASLNVIIQSRVDVLDSDTQQVLKAAAVIGQEFTFDMLQKVYPTKISSAKLTSILWSLIQKHFLCVRDGSDTDGILRSIEFTNTTIREVVYNSFLDSAEAKQKLNLSIANYLQNLNDPSVAFRISSHLSEVIEFSADVAHGSISKFLKYTEIGIDYAEKRRDYSRAVILCKKAIRILELFCPRSEHNLLCTMKMYNNLSYFLPYLVARKSTELHDTLIRAKELCPPDNALRFSILMRLWFTYYTQSKHDEYMPICQEMENICSNHEPNHDTIVTYLYCAMSHYCHGNFQLVCDYVAKGVQIYIERPREYHETLIDDKRNSQKFDHGMFLTTYGQRAHWMLANYEEAEYYFRLGNKWCEEFKHPTSTSLFSVYSAYYLALIRDFPTLKSIAQQSFQSMYEIDKNMMYNLSRSYLGYATVEEGEVDQGIEIIDEALKNIKFFGTANIMTILLLVHALYKKCTLESLARGISLADDVLTGSQDNMKSEAERLKGMILAQMYLKFEEKPSLDEIFYHFDESIRIAEEVSSKSLLLRSLTSKCQYTRLLGQSELRKVAVQSLSDCIATLKITDSHTKFPDVRDALLELSL